MSFFLYRLGRHIVKDHSRRAMSSRRGKRGGGGGGGGRQAPSNQRQQEPTKTKPLPNPQQTSEKESQSEPGVLGLIARKAIDALDESGPYGRTVVHIEGERKLFLDRYTRALLDDGRKGVYDPFEGPAVRKVVGQLALGEAWYKRQSKLMENAIGTSEAQPMNRDETITLLDIMAACEEMDPIIGPYTSRGFWAGLREIIRNFSPVEGRDLDESVTHMLDRILRNTGDYGRHVMSESGLYTLLYGLAKTLIDYGESPEAIAGLIERKSQVWEERRSQLETETRKEMEMERLLDQLLLGEDEYKLHLMLNPSIRKEHVSLVETLIFSRVSMDDISKILAKRIREWKADADRRNRTLFRKALLSIREEGASEAHVLLRMTGAYGKNLLRKEEELSSIGSSYTRALLLASDDFSEYRRYLVLRDELESGDKTVGEVGEELHRRRLAWEEANPQDPELRKERRSRASFEHTKRMIKRAEEKKRLWGEEDEAFAQEQPSSAKRAIVPAAATTTTTTTTAGPGGSSSGVGNDIGVVQGNPVGSRSSSFEGTHSLVYKGRDANGAYFQRGYRQHHYRGGNRYYYGKGRDSKAEAAHKASSHG
jgi:hypothetical protein